MNDELPIATLRNTFKSLGLGPDYAHIYQTSLALGPAPATVLAQTAKVPQSSAYQIVKELVGMGLMEAINGGSKGKAYSVSNPEKLVAIVEERQKLIDQAGEALYEELNGLKTIYHSHKPAFPQFNYFEGDAEIAKLLKTTLTYPEILIFREGRAQSRFHQTPEYLINFSKDTNFRQVKTREIVEYDKYGKEYKDSHANNINRVALVPVKLGDKPAFADKLILTDKVINIIHDDQIAFTVESETIAAQERSLFEILWTEITQHLTI